MTTIRITRRVSEHLQGSQAWYDTISILAAEAKGETFVSREDPDQLALLRKLYEAPTRKDESCTLDLTDDELVVLREYAESLAAVGSDNAWEPDGLADLNAGRACLRQIAKHQFGREEGGSDA